MPNIPILTANELPSGESSLVMSLGEERRNPLRINARTATAESAMQFAERITGIGRKIVEADRVRQYTNGQAKAVKEFAELSSRYQSADFIQATKPGEYQKKFQDDVAGIRDRVFEDVEDQKARERLEASFVESSARAGEAVVTLARGRQIGEGERAVADSVLMNRERAIAAMLAGNTTEMQRAALDASEAITGAEAAGTLSPLKALELRKNYETQVQEGYWLKRIYDDPESAWRELTALGSGALPEGMTQDQYALKLKEAKVATLQAEDIRYRDESRKESKRLSERKEAQDKAEMHMASRILNGEDIPDRGIVDAGDIDMISADGATVLLKMKRAIADEARARAEHREDRSWNKYARNRALEEDLRVDQERRKKANEEEVAASIFASISDAGADGVFSTREEAALRRTINLALIGEEGGPSRIDSATAFRLSGEVDQAAAGRWSNPEWKSAANKLKTTMGVKSDMAPDYNAEKAKAYEVFLYRMQGMVKGGMKPQDALKAILPEATGVKATAETSQLVETYSRLLPDYRSSLEAWAEASLMTIEAEITKINAEVQQSAGNLSPEKKKFANFLKALHRAKQSAQRIGSLEVE